MLQPVKKLLTTVMPLFLIACGGADGGGNYATELEGSWHSPCQVVNDASANEVITFTESSFRLTLNAYSDAACSVPDLSERRDWGTFVIGDTLTTGSGLSAKQIDLEGFISRTIEYSKYYDIFRIDGDKLYFGNADSDNAGSSAAKRPTALNFDSYFTKGQVNI